MRINARSEMISGRYDIKPFGKYVFLSSRQVKAFFYAQRRYAPLNHLTILSLSL